MWDEVVSNKFPENDRDLRDESPSKQERMLVALSKLSLSPKFMTSRFFNPALYVIVNKIDGYYLVLCQNRFTSTQEMFGFFKNHMVNLSWMRSSNF